MSAGHKADIVARKSLWFASCSCGWRSRSRKDKTKIEAFIRDHVIDAPPREMTTNEKIVQICVESRKLPEKIQAAALRDQILSLIDPHMMIAQRIREESK